LQTICLREYEDIISRGRLCVKPHLQDASITNSANVTALMALMPRNLSEWLVSGVVIVAPLVSHLPQKTTSDEMQLTCPRPFRYTKGQKPMFDEEKRL